MNTWDKRPREIRTLFNPAFCGLVLSRAIKEFYEKGGTPMPFSISLLILPLCLHRMTRELLKRTNKTYLTTILQEHPEIRINLAQRTRGLLPYTMEAFAYIMAHDVIVVDNNGGIAVRSDTMRRTISGSQETKDCQTVARMLGRKFANINNRVTIYTALGVKP